MDHESKLGRAVCKICEEIVVSDEGNTCAECWIIVMDEDDPEFEES